MKIKLIYLFLFLPLLVDAQISFEKIGEYRTGIFNQSGTEIIAFNGEENFIYSTNLSSRSVDIIDVSDPIKPVLFSSISLFSFGHHANSIDYYDGVLAVAVEALNPQKDGLVVLFDSKGRYLKEIAVGPMPDMLSFSHDGCFIAVACEGEPNKDYSFDPPGSINLINLSNGYQNVIQKSIEFDIKKAQNLASIIYTENINKTFEEDLEPEYVTFSEDDSKLYVSLQENNAIARINMKTQSLENIVGLGFKDISKVGNGMDVNNKDKKINIDTHQNLFALYQPDAIKSVRINGKDYVISANEGETRKNDAFNNVSRIKKLKLDKKAFPDKEATIKRLGQLKVDNQMGDTDGDGDYDQLYTFGARSFSIWDHNLNQIYDSGDEFEKALYASPFSNQFNANNDKQDSFDARSDDKGCEPEGVITFSINKKTYTLIGLDRMGGFMCYDISDPFHPNFISYCSDRNFSEAVKNASGLGPEGMLFVSQEESTIGHPLVFVANEVSGQISIFKVNLLD